MVPTTFTAIPKRQVPNVEDSLPKGMIGAFTVESSDGHKRGVGTASLTNLVITITDDVARWLYLLLLPIQYFWKLFSHIREGFGR